MAEVVVVVVVVVVVMPHLSSVGAEEEDGRSQLESTEFSILVSLSSGYPLEHSAANVISTQILESLRNTTYSFILVLLDTMVRC